MYVPRQAASSVPDGWFSRLQPRFRETPASALVAEDATSARSERIRCRAVTRSTQASARLLTAPFVLACAVNLLGCLSFFMFVHLPRLLKDLGADEVGIGLIVAATAVASLLARPRIGTAMDRRGRRPAIIAGSLLTTIAVPLYLTIDSVGPWLVAVRVLHGIASALMFVAITTYGADHVPEERRTQGLALFGASSLLPMALGGWLGDVILSAGGFDALFLAAAGFAAASLVLALRLPEARRPVAARGSRPKGGFRRALTQPDLRPVWFITFCQSVVFTGYFTFMRTFVDDTGVGSVGVFYASFAGIAVVLRAFLGWVPDRLGRARVLYASMGSIAAGYLILAAASSAVAVAFAGVLCGAGLGYSFPILFSIVVERAPVEERGSAMAAFTVCGDTGSLVGSPLLGWAILTFDYGVMFYSAATLMVLATVAYGIWETRRQRLLPAAPRAGS
jgi:MFS family permease